MSVSPLRLLVVVLAQRTVADDDELRLAAACPSTLRNESISVVRPLRGSKRPRNRIVGTSFAMPGGARSARMKDVGVDAVRDDLPVGARSSGSSATVVLCETAIAAAQHVEPLLEEALTERVAHRPVEVRVERADDRTIRLLDREQRQDRRERRVHVDDVVLALVAARGASRGADPSRCVMRACDPFAYTGWLRPSRMTFGCGSAPGMFDVMMST